MRPDQAAYRLRPLQVQVLVTGDYLLTLHQERISLPAVVAPDLPEGRSKRYIVYSVLDAMLASTFAALAELELMLDTLAAASTDGGGGRLPRATLRQAGARLASMRRWVGTEQAVLERVGVEIGALRGFDVDDEPYFDRLNEQVNHLLASIDAAANAMGMLLDLQLNERAYVVSVVATIFVPLTFLTGFFGMNFGWMVDQIDGQIAFWLIGLSASHRGRRGVLASLGTPVSHRRRRAAKTPLKARYGAEPSRLRRLLLRGVRGGDASSSAGRELLSDDLKARRDRDADDRPDQPEQRPEGQDAGQHGEAGDSGRLSDDRRLQDVVLDLLIDHDHDREDDQGSRLTDSATSPTMKPAIVAPTFGMRSRMLAITATASGYGRPRITAVTP